MDRGKSAVPRVILPLSVEESTRQRELLQYSSVVESRKWNPSLEQKQILESVWASGTRKPPCEAHIDEITSHLHRYGKAEVKNVYYWFRNEGTREKRRKQQSEAINSDCSAQSNQLGNRVNVEGEEEEEVQRTLELFPLHPDRGGLL
ncbi:WUSCHEL-related homeobox 1-like isoform X2 [Cryptomeria japonica]|uniref:WUSCHEL-related homeobox 1-like isoform X2 n=1 Tax=Cryptomeria japonica TaxID=3369 RepID=UPI0027D9FF26|nr:WUSCHEL-related homeobox 1-like isoform X2 [Cryptomeria japonica]